MAKSTTTTTTNAKRGASAKKAAVAPAKKQTAKKAAAKKATATTATTKTATAKKTPAKKATAKTAPAKTATAKTAPAKKATAKTAPAPAKKSAAKKPAAKKSAPKKAVGKTDLAPPMPAPAPVAKSGKKASSKTAVAPPMPTPAPSAAGSKPAKKRTGKQASSMSDVAAPTPAPGPSAAAGSKPAKKRPAKQLTAKPEADDNDDDDGQSPAAARPGGAASVSGSATFRGFGPGLFEFLAELALNNDRSWFEAHKRRYESEVREPALAFVRAMGSRLAELSEHFIASAQKVGGSLMRIHRDTRFSPDKTPYKTNLGVQFRHAAGKDVHAPGLYVHVDNDGVFLGSGTWHPEPEPLAAIRKAIVEQPDAWQAARDDEGFRKHWALEGDSLTRPPRGFDKQHPCVDDLRRKDHIAVSRMNADEIMRPDMVDRITARFVASSPYMRFLCKAIGVSF